MSSSACCSRLAASAWLVALAFINKLLDAFGGGARGGDNATRVRRTGGSRSQFRSEGLSLDPRGRKPGGGHFHELVGLRPRALACGLFAWLYRSRSILVGDIASVVRHAARA